MNTIKKFNDFKSINEEMYMWGGWPNYLDDNFIVNKNLLVTRKDPKSTDTHNKPYNDAEIANELIDNFDCDYNKALEYIETWKEHRFNEIKEGGKLKNKFLKNEEYSIDPENEDGEISVTVKDIIDFLSTLPPDATTSLDHDGWEYDGGGDTGLEIVKNSPLFYFDERENHLFINN